MMKKLLLLSIAMVAMQTVARAEDNHLYIQPTAGETLSWSVPTLQKMSFQDGNVVLTKKDGTTAYAPIATIERMYIDSPSSIGQTGLNGEAPLCLWEGDILKINAQPGTLVVVYNVAGAVVKSERLAGNTIDLSGTRKGLYIVNVDGQIVKTIKK